MSTLFDPASIPVPEPEGPETVGELTLRIQGVLEDEFPNVWVVGEISNFNRHTSGHVFFTLKDERAAIRCVLWKSAAARLPRDVADGVEVEVRGHLSLFARQGNYQIYVSSIRLRGAGALEVAFRKLKERLEREGLFDPARKRPLPRFPRCVGVVTSPAGAAVRDVIRILRERWPAIQVVLAPARVQGEGAAADIARGIEALSRLGGIDVMIVGRGGGSLEDLWPFNEEVVARAIYASAVPVVSAVGHETDFSISDFVADARAATPSAAAAMVVPERREVEAALGNLQARLARGMKHVADLLRDELALVEANRFFRYPQQVVLDRVQALEDLQRRLAGAVRDGWSARRLRLERGAGALAKFAPHARWQKCAGALRMAAFRLHAAGRALLVHRYAARLDGLGGRLEALSPDRVLARGYSRTVLERTGRTLVRAADAAAGDLLRTHLAQGTLRSRVTEGEGDPLERRT
ncbi:MAG: exodeoxyribonuclease VII large subunit [Planctomycetes bacterium]|nr:exodeoxyribonuclease VII large subunit [Planctomycetota bacterium]